MTLVDHRIGPPGGPRAPAPPPATAAGRPPSGRRRRLLLRSLPVVVLLVLVAARLVLLQPVHERTLAAYRDGDPRRTLAWADRQGWLNVVERFRAPFAVGAAHVLAGNFDLARPAFEAALEQVPGGGIDECRVRVNLGLTYERLGDAARAQGRVTEQQQYYDKGLETTRNRPPLCDLPQEGGGTGQQLREAQQRMEDKNTGQGAQPPPSRDAPAQPGPVPPTPDPRRVPSQEQQDALREQQRRSTVERNERQQQRRGTGTQAPSPDAPTYPKPW